MNKAIIAQHLNISDLAIKRVEEWADIIFVVIEKIGARFVSKKIIKQEELSQATDKSSEKTKLHFIPRTQIDASLATDLLVDFCYEWNADYGCFTFEEDEDLIDNLEFEISNLFGNQVNGYFEAE